MRKSSIRIRIIKLSIILAALRLKLCINNKGRKSNTSRIILAIE